MTDHDFIDINPPVEAPGAAPGNGKVRASGEAPATEDAFANGEAGVMDPAHRIAGESGPEVAPSMMTKVADLDTAMIEAMTAKIVAAIKTVYDPEIPVDIYELGLIYQVDLEDNGLVKVEMTLTAPGCPVAGEMPEWVREAVVELDEVSRVEVDMVFDPPWTPERMSDEAKLQLGWM